MEKPQVRCLDCARLSEDRLHCVSTLRSVSADSMRRCKRFLALNYRERIAGEGAEKEAVGND